MRSGRKMAIITFVALCAAIIVAAFNFQDHSWKQIIAPEPGFPLGNRLPILAWVFMIGSVLSFGAMGYVHSLVAEKHAAWKKAHPDKPSPPPALTPEELWVQERLAEGFHEFKPVAVRQPDGSEKSFRLFAQPEHVGTNNIITRTVTMKHEDGESSFTYSVLFDDYSWKKKSERQFKGRGSQGVPIERALQDEYLRKGIESAPRVLCLGLASEEADTLTEAENEALSDARARNLCIALINLGYIKPGPQVAIGIGAGYAKQSPSEVADIDKQRVAVVISVHYNTAKVFDVEPFILSMNQLITMKGVDLEKYSREPANFTTTDPVVGGAYTTYKNIVLSTRDSNVIVPIIAKPTSTQD